MRKSVKITVAVLSGLVLIGLSLLPIMSVYSGGELVSGRIFVRGYNLMSFSSWGCAPILAAVLMPVIFLGCQSNATKEAELLLLFVVSVVGYLHGFHAAREWLETIGDARIVYYMGEHMWPMSFLLLIVLAVLIGKGSRKNAAPCIQSTCFPPARMENHVFFPNRILCRLNSLMTGKEDIPDEALLEKLTEAYQRAWEKGDCRMCGTSLVFDTDLQTKDGKFLRGMLIPDPNDPTPNTWRLSELECVEK